MQNITGLTYVPETNLWTVDAGCSNLTALENITITLGYDKFVLRPDQYVLQVRPYTHPLQQHAEMRHFEKPAKATCIPARPKYMPQRPEPAREQVSALAASWQVPASPCCSWRLAPFIALNIWHETYDCHCSVPPSSREHMVAQGPTKFITGCHVLSRHKF